MSKRVFCYFNLHRRCFSIRDVSTGLVIAHARIVRLRDVNLKVSEAGRQRVIREQRKNVHAGIEGTLVSADTQEQVPLLSRRVTYNPYVTPTFVDADTRESVRYAGEAVLSTHGANNIPAVFVSQPIGA